MKLKGGMLYYTLFLMIISTSIITLLLLRGYLFLNIYIESEKISQLERDNESALNIYLEGVDLFSQSDSFALNLYDDSLSIVNVEKTKWGIYDLVSVLSSWKNKTISRTGLFGTDLDRGEGIALYLTDAGINLSLSGSSLINGICYVPEGIIKPASVEGHPFIYKKTTTGAVKTSNRTLPPIDNEVPESVLSLFYNIETSNSYQKLLAENNSTIENSFLNPVCTYFEEESIKIQNVSLKGHIIIASPGTITISPSAYLENVIILARNIVIEEGFSGSFQGFALGSIMVDKNAHLEYPSVLAIIQDTLKEISSNNLCIEINENSVVTGSIIISANDNCGTIKIMKNTKVYGQVYCAGSVNLTGDIYGSLYCNSFRFSSSRTNYVNHILDGDIDFSKLPKRFSGVDLENWNNKKDLIKWVN